MEKIENSGKPSCTSTARVWSHENRIAWLGFLCALLLIAVICSVPLGYEQQLIFAFFSIGVALLIRYNSHQNYFRVILLIFVSVITSGRYIYWRLTESLVFDTTVDFTFFDYFFAYGLLGAEIYAWTIMFLGYFQTIWPLQREVEPLPDDVAKWPSVDVFIPTYNEPMNVVAPTILASKNLDWPKDKLNVYVLDDGCRDEFRSFAEGAGVHYIERKESTHAKAGNINRALGMCRGEFVAIFDCDHIPVRSFLKKTMGWFLRKSKLGLIQTPHLFFSPDPLERNLGIFRRVPNEGQLFYGLIQDGNDTWNSTFFCGSCAVLRREALDDVGGIAVETVTEDAHTSLRMHRKGWSSAYLNIPQAAGLATDRLAGHVGQRIRWARGMVQILRIDNPLFGRGLKLSQRLNYFNAMGYFLYSVPRLIFLTAPLAFLFFEAHVFQAAAMTIAVYAIPHIIQSHIANSALQGRFRHGIWSEVYETILAAHILLPTLAALINPKWGSFNVTEKGSKIENDQFEWRIALPYFVILLMNLAGFAIGVGHLVWWHAYETSTVIMNLVWTSYNLIILGAALAVAWEKRQQRENVRIPRREQVVLRLENGSELSATTTDLSFSGVSLELSQHTHLESGAPVTIEINDNREAHAFKGRVSSIRQNNIGIEFEAMEPHEMGKLVHITHGREDAWVDWYKSCEPDWLLNSFAQVIRYGLSGLGRSLFGFTSTPQWVSSRSYALTSWLFLFLVVLMVGLFTPHKAQAKALEFESNYAATYYDVSLKELGVEKPFRLRIGESTKRVPFMIRSNQVVTSARLKLKYSISPKKTFDTAQLEVRINDTVIGEIPIENNTATYQVNRDLLTIDPLLIGEYNNLSLRVAAQNSDDCETVSPGGSIVAISNDSELFLNGRKLKLVNDLEMFPVPFFDLRDHRELVLPFVFGPNVAESLLLLKSAGILASWFGSFSDYRGARFPVFVDSLPKSNAIVLVTPNHHPNSIVMPTIPGAGLKLIDHPENPYAKLLLVIGEDEKGLLNMVRALVLGQIKLKGDKVTFKSNQSRLRHREPYDAPRWISTRHETPFNKLSGPDNLFINGNPSDLIKVNFRMPPDLFVWQSRGVPVKLSHRYSNVPLEHGGSLNVSINENPLIRIALKEQTENHADAAGSKRSFLNRGDVSTGTDEQISDERRFYIPFEKVSGLNQLQFYYDFNDKTQDVQSCNPAQLDTFRAGINENSTIDLSGFLHYARMPDLATFANMGFPFTRYADLSETVIIIPEKVVAFEIQMLLDILGKFGAATGYPSIKSTLLRPWQIDKAQDKDILLVGTAADQPLLSKWRMKLPIVYSERENAWQRRELTTRERARLWWNSMKDVYDISDADRAMSSSGQSFVGLVGTRSPLNPDRNLVAMVTSSPDLFSRITDVLNDSDRIRAVQGDFVLFNGDRVSAFRITPNYFLGELPFSIKIRWYLSQHLIVLALLFISAVFIGAVFLQKLLRHRAEARIKVNA